MQLSLIKHVHCGSQRPFASHILSLHAQYTQEEDTVRAEDTCNNSFQINFAAMPAL